MFNNKRDISSICGVLCIVNIINLTTLFIIQLENSSPKRNKRSKRNQEAVTTAPAFYTAPSAIILAKKNQSEAKRIQKEEKKNLKLWLSISRKMLRLYGHRSPGESLQGKQDIEKLEAICNNNLGPGREAKHLSAQIIDKDGKPIHSYFGARIIPSDWKPPVICLIIWMYIFSYISQARN